jgi:hypothetical protein
MRPRQYLCHGQLLPASSQNLCPPHSPLRFFKPKWPLIRLRSAWDDALLRDRRSQDVLEQRLSSRKVRASCSRCCVQREAIAAYAQWAFEVRVARACTGTWMRKKAWTPKRERRARWRIRARHCGGDQLSVASRLCALRLGFDFVTLVRKKLAALAVAKHARDRPFQDLGDFPSLQMTKPQESRCSLVCRLCGGRARHREAWLNAQWQETNEWVREQSVHDP